MPQIREIRKRIRSIENTKKVTHAMELVAAAKMRKSQLAALASRPYSTSLDEILDQVKALSHKRHTLLQKKDSANEVVILVTSDRGLAGGLNINLFREIGRRDDQLLPLSDTPKTGRLTTQYITVGKKALAFAVKTGNQILGSYQSEEKTPLDLARTLTKMVTDAFKRSQASKVSLLYSHFESTVKQTPKWIQLLPIELTRVDLPIYPTIQLSNYLLFEPSTDQILESILPHYILTRIYQVLLETKASEHSARMVAMKNATDAASDLIEDLTLTYNQIRQETITKELADIITAQKAFE